MDCIRSHWQDGLYIDIIRLARPFASWSDLNRVGFNLCSRREATAGLGRNAGNFWIVIWRDRLYRYADSDNHRQDLGATVSRALDNLPDRSHRILRPAGRIVRRSCHAPRTIAHAALALKISVDRIKCNEASP